jgi:hypothetical protein
MIASQLLPEETGKVTQGHEHPIGSPEHHPNSEEPNSVGHVETRTYQFALPPNELTLESGEKLGPITAAYETYGE